MDAALDQQMSKVEACLKILENIFVLLFFFFFFPFIHSPFLMMTEGGVFYGCSKFCILSEKTTNILIFLKI